MPYYLIEAKVFKLSFSIVNVQLVDNQDIFGELWEIAEAWASFVIDFDLYTNMFELGPNGTIICIPCVEEVVDEALGVL